MKQSAISSSLLAIAALLCCAQFSVASAQIVEIPTSEESVRLEIQRSAHRVTLYRGEVAFKNYPVAVGRPGWETPLGDFEVFQMMRNPAWKHPLNGKVFPAGDPKNQLGQYWIGFSTRGELLVGFHGTPQPETVGKPVSHGCVRMYGGDIAELFHLVSLGTAVRVVP